MFLQNLDFFLCILLEVLQIFTSIRICSYCFSGPTFSKMVFLHSFLLFDFETANHVKRFSEKETTLLQLQNLLDEAILKEIFSSIRKQERNSTSKEATPKPPTILNSKPKPPSKPLSPKPPIPSFEDRFQEIAITPNKSPLEYNPQKPSFAGSFSNGQLSQLIPPGNPLPTSKTTFEDRIQQINHLKSDKKNPIIQPVKPWPTNHFTIIFEDKFQEIITSTTTQRPFAGQSTNVQLSQLADDSIPTFEDKFQEVLPSSSKSPLEYNGQRPSFASQFSNGQLSQLIPSRNPLPAGPSSSVPVKDRFEDDSEEPQIALPTATKSPLEYHGQRPSFAGQFSNGQPSQLVPSNPLPAGSSSFIPVKDRFEDDNDEPQIASSTTTKSPLEYHGQKPSFAGQFSNGQPSQLIPSGNPLPAGPLSSVPVKDRFEDDSEEPQIDLSTTTKSPLEYHGQKPSFAGQFSNGQPSQLVPFGNPLPPGPSSSVPVKDRFEDDNDEPQIALSTTTKSPLEYHGQRPSFAGQFSNGQPSQLIPSGNPLPAGPSSSVPVKDRFEDDSEEPQIDLSTTIKSPLEYHGQKPSFAGQFSNGQPSQLIPSGNPLPAGPSKSVPVKDLSEENDEHAKAVSIANESSLENILVKPRPVISKMS
ncbi:unnamed protein product [Ceutorhynchus assimilis]|uniref:Uncharacterized protein n=1 Tax=Ceutorhynchus assimilis TaxID=467358 RepID=A0A9N9MZM6_9CUCU|nr:unnamed protein product [Ceutorhynchus assimilis]